MYLSSGCKLTKNRLSRRTRLHTISGVQGRLRIYRHCLHRWWTGPHKLFSRWFTLLRTTFVPRVSCNLGDTFPNNRNVKKIFTRISRILTLCYVSYTFSLQSELCSYLNGQHVKDCRKSFQDKVRWPQGASIVANYGCGGVEAQSLSMYRLHGPS